MTKLEAGKTYRTRNGLSARILATDKKGAHSIAGLITQDNGHEIWYSWREDGTSLALGKGDFDLIIPTELKSVWLNWYSPADSYPTRKDADKWAAPGRTHVLEIITENGKPVDVKIYETKK